MYIKNYGYSVQNTFHLSGILTYVRKIVMLKWIESGEFVHYLEACVVIVVF
jgi:hypothetical protein